MGMRNTGLMIFLTNLLIKIMQKKMKYLGLRMDHKHLLQIIIKMMPTLIFLEIRTLLISKVFMKIKKYLNFLFLIESNPLPIHII